MTISAYPAAVDALIAILEAGLPGVRVFQGSGGSDTKAHRFVHVGLESLDASVFPGTAGSGAVSWGPMGTAHKRDERFGVNCVARVWGGGNNPGQRRDDTFSLFGAAVSAIQADPSIGRPGGVLYVDTYTWSYSQQFDGDGTSGLIDFTLNFRARI